MEFSIEYNINGELLIPLEDTFNQRINNGTYESSASLSHYLTYNYSKFRAILYQNEIMRMIIGIRFTKIQGEEGEPETKIEDIVKDLNIQIEFSVDSDLDNNTQDNIDYDPIEKSYQTIITKTNHEIKQENESIKRRYINEEKKIALIEVIKHIQVPNYYLNNLLLLKVSLVKKTNISFLKQVPITNIYTFKNTEEYTLIKTLFKEVKIIQPLQISELKQLDCTSDLSLIQIKLENVTAGINMIDYSLIKSQLLMGKEDKNITEVYFGIDICIREIQIRKEETIIDTKMIINLDEKEQYFKADIVPLKLDLLMFEFCNNNIYPIKIHPGLDYNIIIKVYKDNTFFDQLNTTVNNNVVNNFKRKNSTKKKLNDIIKKQSTIALDQSFTNYKPELTLSNLNRVSTHKLSSLMCLTEGKENEHNNTKSIKMKRNSNTSQRIKEEIIKYIMSTPICLTIASDNGYFDRTSILFSIKWKNEYRNSLQVKMQIVNEKIPILLFQYFAVKFIFENMSPNIIYLSVKFSESFDAIQIDKNHLNKQFYTMSNDFASSEGIISEIKEANIGIIKSRETKEINYRFLPIKLGYHYLPSIEVHYKDKEKSSLKYIMYHTQTLYVNEYNND